MKLATAAKKEAPIARGLNFWLTLTNESYCGNGTPLVPDARFGLQGKLTGWLAGEGGFRFGEEKSKNSSMSAWAASRAVRLGRLNRFSTNFKTAV
jgi:hypothetical protein